MDHEHDDAPKGRLAARRELLGLFATTAGVAVVATYLPAGGRRVASGAARLFGSVTAGAATLPSCIVRPEQTEGPYFVDERLNRSDIRSDPSNGSVSVGVPLALTFAVGRIDGSACAPFEGVVIDVWHCDAVGVYSDVQDPGFNTSGRKFLRGYQVTDADGIASFVTIYPGWYQGRTVHVHFKLRTDPDADTGLEFTSQLFFDDDLTDVVHSQQPYAAKGQRTLRNDGDGIYQDGGSELLLTLEADGSGGYVARFDIGVEASGTTTTTLPGGSCTTIDACLAGLESALPDPASAANRKTRRIARALQRRTTKLSAILTRAGASSSRRRTKLYAKARAGLQALLTASRTADGKGTLGVSLASLEAAIDALLAQLPSSA